MLSEGPGRGGQQAEPESFPWTKPNNRLQATAYSVRSAPAFSRA